MEKSDDVYKCMEGIKKNFLIDKIGRIKNGQYKKYKETNVKRI